MREVQILKKETGLGAKTSGKRLITMQEKRSDRYKKKKDLVREEKPYAAEPEEELAEAPSVEEEPAPKRRRSVNSGKVWLAVLVAAVACLGVIAVAAAQSMQEPPHPTLNISETASPSPTPTPTATEEHEEIATATPVPTPTPKVMIPEMAELYQQNSDLAGWIKIDGTIIDYPVMYTPDEFDYYLYRTFEKEEDPTKQGCIFIDSNCIPDPRGTNLLLHGHNMKRGTMFHSLIEYEDIDYWREHPTIKYTTLYDQEEYEIVYAFRSRVYDAEDDVFKYYKFYQANTPEEFNDFVNGCRGLALYDTGIVPEFGDEFLTLNTCEYTVDNGRMVVVARKIKDDAERAADAAQAQAVATTTSRVVAPPSGTLDPTSDPSELSERITVYGEITG